LDGLKLSSSIGNDFILRFKDNSLERLYSVLFTYCELYSGCDYSFKIYRRSKFYELVFCGESARGGGS